MIDEKQFGREENGILSKGSEQTDTLRRRAEDIFLRKAAGMPKDLEALSPEEVRQLVYDLQVYQIELEMQNEELHRSQRELEASRARYFDLYDLAPAGYFTLNESGLILEVNLTAATLLGVARSALVKQPLTRFILPADQDIFYRHRKLFFETESPQVCEIRILRAGAAPFWVRIDATVVRDVDSAFICRAMMVDITDLKQSEEALRKSAEWMRRALGATVQAIAVIVETRDPYTAGHQKKVADLARAMATEMNLPANRTDGIRMASAIHDLGKISVPAEILSNPKKLTALEFSLIKTHAQSGYDILKGIEFPWPVARMVLEHHERMDGSGYPQGLIGEEILLESRILAVADVVESMASHRPYRPALGLDPALKEIENNKGTLYDSGAVDACLRIFRGKGYKMIG
ncbi:MAG: HD domain-containing protein [Syntrophales bacterium]|jgi:PAS domain S-box-containing protein|nr:HD domain-containing protein [Syntrophales bacterium]MCK9390980.1 HD domain-containing protein [Syntrophales bacterium]